MLRYKGGELDVVDNGRDICLKMGKRQEDNTKITMSMKLTNSEVDQLIETLQMTKKRANHVWRDDGSIRLEEKAMAKNAEEAKKIEKWWAEDMKRFGSIPRHEESEVPI